MKILHLSNTPLSNSPQNLVTIQRAAGHEAELLLAQAHNTNNVLVGGQLWPRLQADQITYLFEKAAVIHMHNFSWRQEIFAKHPHLIDICKKKRCLIQYHSPRRSRENFEDTLTDPFFKKRKAVIAQYHVREYPEAEYVVPNVLPIYDPIHTPIKNKPHLPLPIVSYAASNTNLKGWDDKGFDFTTDAIRSLERRHLAQGEIITGLPHKETLERKRWADVGIEEVATGSYHMSFLEYMSVGAATVCNLDDATRAAMAMVIGYDAVQELPAIRTDRHQLERDLTDLVSDRTRLAQMGSSVAHGWRSTGRQPHL